MVNLLPSLIASHLCLWYTLKSVIGCGYPLDHFTRRVPRADSHGCTEFPRIESSDWDGFPCVMSCDRIESPRVKLGLKAQLEKLLVVQTSLCGITSNSVYHVD